MEIYSVARRMSVLTLLLATLLLVGMPRPTMAARQEDVAVTRHRALTINGRPLSEFVTLPAPPPVPPPHRRRVSADRLLGGEPVTDSLDALTSILDPGYEVVVWDEAGRKTRGRVSYISGDEVVVINRPRLFRYLRSPQEHAFRADAVTRVEIVDSTWNGIAIGAAVGAGLAFGLWQGTDTDDFGVGLLYAVSATAALPASMLAGRDIDLSINESIYTRPSQSPRVTIAPLIGRDQKGLAVRVSF